MHSIIFSDARDAAGIAEHAFDHSIPLDSSHTNASLGMSVGLSAVASKSGSVAWAAAGVLAGGPFKLCYGLSGALCRGWDVNFPRMSF